MQLTQDGHLDYLNSGLPIPVVMHEECLHGHAGIDTTRFSQSIGLAAKLMSICAAAF
jgi:hypothetical protein